VQRDESTEVRDLFDSVRAGERARGDSPLTAWTGTAPTSTLAAGAAPPSSTVGRFHIVYIESDAADSVLAPQQASSMQTTCAPEPW
jgi:hypothetical protein